MLTGSFVTIGFIFSMLIGKAIFFMIEFRFSSFELSIALLHRYFYSLCRSFVHNSMLVK